MDCRTTAADYQNILKLAEQGRHRQAFELIENYLRSNPDNAEMWNDAGAILHCLGESQQAAEYFKKAASLESASPDILCNLAEAYLCIGKPHLAAELFAQMNKFKALNPDLLNRTVSALLDGNDKAMAIETLLLSLQIWPQQKVLNPMLDIIKSKRPRIAFFCGADGRTFLEDILEFTRQRFDVRFFDGTTQEQMQELMQWSDISWFEWCTNLAAIGTNLPKTCKTIVRLHRYEAYSDWPKKVNWQNVDTLITTGNPITIQMLRNNADNLHQAANIVSIPNGVNLDKFRFIDRKKGKNIAFLANLRMVKNPAFLIQCMQKLNYIDKGYKLYIAGNVFEPETEQYLHHIVNVLKLNDVVFFEPFQKDVFGWLCDKHYIVSTSIIEGQPLNILEGMACGLKPVVHNFPGAECLCPKKYIFNISEQFCEQILSDDYNPIDYRKFVEEKYSLSRQLEQINRLFLEFEKQLDSGKLHNQPIQPLAVENDVQQNVCV